MIIYILSCLNERFHRDKVFWGCQRYVFTPHSETSYRWRRIVRSNVCPADELWHLKESDRMHISEYYLTLLQCGYWQYSVFFCSVHPGSNRYMGIVEFCQWNDNSMDSEINMVRVEPISMILSFISFCWVLALQFLLWHRKTIWTFSCPSKLGKMFVSQCLFAFLTN